MLVNLLTPFPLQVDILFWITFDGTNAMENKGR